MKIKLLASMLASCCVESSFVFAALEPSSTDCSLRGSASTSCRSSSADNLDRLIDQSWFWQKKNRVDLSRNVLRKALHIDYKNATILQRLVEIEAESRRYDSALQYLKRLASTGDTVRYLAARESLVTFQSHHREVAQARLLTRNNRREQALAIWNTLIPGVPKGHLALEMLPLRMQHGDKQASLQLQSLARAFASDPRYVEYRNEPPQMTAQTQEPARTVEPARQRIESLAQAISRVSDTAMTAGLSLEMSYELGVAEVPAIVSVADKQETMKVAAADRTAVFSAIAQRETFQFPEPAPVKPRPDPTQVTRPANWAWQLSRIWLNNPGTPGVSDLNQTVDLAHVERETDSSKTQFWLEYWNMDGGAAQGSADFGTAKSSTPPWTLGAQGAGFGLAYETQGWRFDFGHTPYSFAINYPVFGIRKEWTAAGANLSAEFSRRPLSESILSFAGARDPESGLTWGGAKATGLKLTYDKSMDAWDVGAKAAFYRIQGVDIIDNHKLDLSLAGSYTRKVWNDTTLKAGVKLAHWQYSNNTNYYRFGHAGYYSPHKYYSLDLPLELAGQTGRQSYRLTGGVSVSYKQTRDIAEFPLTSTGDVFEGSSGSASGWYLSATWEYRITDTLALGARVGQESSPYYEPTTVMLYLRHDNADKLRWRATYPRDSYFKE
ncbi:MAG TPA: cellulose synthase subunit BcsC-related outer membrane protein [Thiobacillus sp.]